MKIAITSIIVASLIIIPNICLLVAPIEFKLANSLFLSCIEILKIEYMNVIAIITIRIIKNSIIPIIFKSSSSFIFHIPE